MAESTIKISGIGNETSVSMPYTVPRDGIFYMRMKPTSSQGSYLQVSVNGSDKFDLMSPAGSNISASYPVKAGWTLSVGAIYNATPTYLFYPIL